MPFYSPLRYPGGKTILAPYFEKIISKNKLEKCTYIEPYAGGAGAGLSLLLQNKVNKIIINDLDSAIYSFWKSAVFDTNAFIDKISSTPVTLEEWKKQKNVYKIKRIGFELGFATFFLNRTNMSGIIDGGPIGGMKQNSKWKLDARFNKKDLIGRIQNLAFFKDRIEVTNKDGIELLQEFKRFGKTFVYLDPPYYRKGDFLYLNSYGEKDHGNLAKFLNKKQNFNWILTYDNVGQIKELYKERRIRKFPIRYSARIRRKDSELMIFSDALRLN